MFVEGWTDSGSTLHGDCHALLGRLSEPECEKYAWVRSHEKYAWILEPQMQRKFDQSHERLRNHESSSICWPWTGPIRRKGRSSNTTNTDSNVSYLGYGWLIQKGLFAGKMGAIAPRGCWIRRRDTARARSSRIPSVEIPVREPAAP